MRCLHNEVTKLHQLEETNNVVRWLQLLLMSITRTSIRKTMTALIRVCSTLAILFTVLLTLRPFLTYNQKTYWRACSDHSTSDHNSGQKSWTSPSEAWEMFLMFIYGKTKTHCETHKTYIWTLLTKWGDRKEKSDGELLRYFYGFGEYLYGSSNWHFLQVVPQERSDFHPVAAVSSLSVDKSETDSGDLSFDAHSHKVGDVNYGLEDLLLDRQLWGVIQGVLVSYIIWKMLDKERAFINGSKQHRFHGALTQTIVSKYFAVKLMSVSPNFYTFHLVSKTTKQSVWLKSLRSHGTRTAKIGLAREYRALKVLHHKNIIQVADWLRAGYSISLGLEFAKYGHLHIAIKDHHSSFSLMEKLNVFRQIVEAVIFLHKSGLAHLNIRYNSAVVFEKWSLVKLSGFSRVTKVSGKKLCNRFDLHPASVPADVIITRELYNPFKVDCWALGALWLYILTEGASLTASSPRFLVLYSISQCDLRCKKIILALLSDLLSADPNKRPYPPDIVKFLDKLEK